MPAAVLEAADVGVVVSAVRPSAVDEDAHQSVDHRPVLLVDLSQRVFVDRKNLVESFLDVFRLRLLRRFVERDCCCLDRDGWLVGCCLRPLNLVEQRLAHLRVSSLPDDWVWNAHEVLQLVEAGRHWDVGALSLACCCTRSFRRGCDATGLARLAGYFCASLILEIWCRFGGKIGYRVGGRFRVALLALLFVQRRELYFCRRLRALSRRLVGQWFFFQLAVQLFLSVGEILTQACSATLRVCTACSICCFRVLHIISLF